MGLVFLSIQLTYAFWLEHLSHLYFFTSRLPLLYIILPLIFVFVFLGSVVDSCEFVVILLFIVFDLVLFLR